MTRPAIVAIAALVAAGIAIYLHERAWWRRWEAQQRRARIHLVTQGEPA